MSKEPREKDHATDQHVAELCPRCSNEVETRTKKRSVLLQCSCGVTWTATVPGDDAGKP